jgi:Lipase (class 3)
MQSPDKMMKPVAVSAALQSSPAPGGFSASFAQVMAACSALAYSEATCTDKATNASANVSCIINTIIVAFKGSAEAKDFIQDAKFDLVPLVWMPGNTSEVHAGFLEDFQAITIAVVSQVKGYLQSNPNAKVFVTGHSLGGALAILCAIEFHRQNIPVAAVHTFGQPRVGNLPFCHLYDTALRDVTFRLVNANDIVPRVPGHLMDYADCGHEIFLPVENNSFQVDPDLAQKILSDEMGFCEAIVMGHDVLITDHFIADYQKRIALIP